MCWFNIFNKDISKKQIMRILQAEKFMDAYYYIRKVMNVNELKGNSQMEAITGLWAFKVMDQRKMHIANKYHGRIRRVLLFQMQEFIDCLHDYHQEVRIKLAKKLNNI